MKGDARKAASTAYKEKKVSAGIYAVRCLPTGQIWVGRAPDLDTIRNRLWFTLQLGDNPHPSLQGAWTEYGADSFSFEVLERIDKSDSAYVRQASLKQRLAYWSATLGAAKI